MWSKSKFMNYQHSDFTEIRFLKWSESRLYQKASFDADMTPAMRGDRRMGTLITARAAMQMKRRWDYTTETQAIWATRCSCSLTVILASLTLVWSCWSWRLKKGNFVLTVLFQQIITLAQNVDQRALTDSWVMLAEVSNCSRTSKTDVHSSWILTTCWGITDCSTSDW